ncbi:Phage major capsid protein [Escherichia coli]|nr:Phage major capsid protein [Escherichia coli]
MENGVKKNFLPDNTMVLGNTHPRRLRTYGCIQDADAQREGINASARYPKNWVTTGDPAREFTMIQSAPLMLLADPHVTVVGLVKLHTDALHATRDNLWHLCCRERRFVSLPVWQPK